MSINRCLFSINYYGLVSQVHIPIVVEVDSLSGFLFVEIRSFNWYLVPCYVTDSLYC
ncbi:hypothetical protein BVRB_5g118630 [Beta vulgaris subsp. vulgaris]|nr:hypothetical protein BVRB_5g118630 [Beta vulgaris subsp. vulgaris]